MKYRVGLLYDSISKNSGDEAVGIAMQQALAKFDDIEVDIVDPYDYDEEAYTKLIIGGGQLLRKSGDDFYDRFRVKGNHILNGVGLSNPIDKFEYLDSYSFVSARTNDEVAMLSEFTAKAEVLPCMTTLMTHSHYEIPGLKKGEKAIGIHVVPYTYQLCPEIVDIINKLPYKKVFIPFTHYLKDRSFMSSLPFDFSNSIILDDLSPTQLHSVISQMNYVVVSSLHASIFAYSQNIPFATLGQEKVKTYFRDRGLSEYVFSDANQLNQIIDNIHSKRPNFEGLINKDRKILHETLLKYRGIITRGKDVSSLRSVSFKESNDSLSSAYKLRMHSELSGHVIESRDRLIADLINRSTERAAELAAKERKIVHLRSTLQASLESTNAVKYSKSFRVGYLILHPKELPRKAIHRFVEISRAVIERYLGYVDARKVLAHYDNIQKDLSRCTNNANKKLAVVLHLYYVDLWPYFVEKLETLNRDDYDLFISLPVDKSVFKKDIEAEFSNARIFLVPNRGRDVLPFVMIAKNLKELGYSKVLKIHSKKSKHRIDGGDWMDGIISSLLPNDKELLVQVLEKLDKPETGIIGPENEYVALPVNYDSNRSNFLKIITRLTSTEVCEDVDGNRFDYGFFAGTMFWARIDAIEKTLHDHQVKYFEREKMQIDNTYAHALERAFCVYAEVNNKNIYGLSTNALCRLKYGSGRIPEWSDVISDDQ
jgi:hypothetical protein